MSGPAQATGNCMSGPAQATGNCVSGPAQAAGNVAQTGGLRYPLTSNIAVSAMGY